MAEVSFRCKQINMVIMSQVPSKNSTVSKTSASSRSIRLAAYQMMAVRGVLIGLRLRAVMSRVESILMPGHRLPYAIRCHVAAFRRLQQGLSRVGFQTIHHTSGDVSNSTKPYLSCCSEAADQQALCTWVKLPLLESALAVSSGRFDCSDLVVE